MPETQARYTPPSFEDDDNHANAEYLKRKQKIEMYREYYEGDQKPPLKSDNIILNLCGQVVNDMASFCANEPPQVRIEGGFDRVKEANLETGKEELVEVRSPEQIKLDEFWEANNFAEWLMDVFLSGQVAGHNFVRLIVDDGLQWEEVGTGQDISVRVEMLDQVFTQAFWRPSNRKEVLWYRLSWTEAVTGSKGEARRQDIVPMWLYENRAPELNDGWLIIEYAETGGKRFQEIGRDVWLYPFAPIVDWKNKHEPFDFYGCSDLAYITRLNDSVNFIASNTGKIIKYHASPKTVVLGAAANQVVPTAIENILSIDEDNAKIENLEMQSDLASSMNFQQQLEAKFFAATGVVDLATVRDKLGQITNFGVRMMFSKQLAQATMKRRLYGDGIAEISRRALAIMGVTVKKPTVTWKDPLPLNELEATDTALKQNSGGFASKQTLTEKLGYDFGIEQAQIAEETIDELAAKVDEVTQLQSVGGDSGNPFGG
jgi:SPP1 Gp6-like portal protein